MRLAGNMNFHLAFDHLHQRVERRGVFAQALAFVKGKYRHRAGGFLDQFAAHDGAVLVIDQFGGLTTCAPVNPLDFGCVSCFIMAPFVLVVPARAGMILR